MSPSRKKKTVTAAASAASPSESGSRQRRQRRPTVSYKEEEEESDADEEYKNSNSNSSDDSDSDEGLETLVAKRRRKSNPKERSAAKAKPAATRTRAKARTPNKKDTKNDTDDAADANGSTPLTTKRRRRTQTNTANDAFVDKTKTTCPHCNRTFTTIAGAKYHVEHFVCRPAEDPTDPQNNQRSKPNKKHKKSRDPSAASSSSTRIRGALDDRTCPHCQRVFTSIHGLTYHTDNKVCQLGHKQSTGVPFPTLQPGQCFVTKFGVVQVIRDDRATPSVAGHPPDIQRQLKAYHKAVHKRQARIQRDIENVTVETRVRNILLQRAYDHYAEQQQPQNQNQPQLYAQAVSEAYQRATLPVPQHQRLDHKLQVQRLDHKLQDPAAPDESYPDRIVECVWIPDRRARVIGTTKKDNNDDHDDNDNNNTNNSVIEGLTASQQQQQEQQQPLRPIQMFLARRLLTTPYSETGIRYQCPQCWTCFTSKVGFKYHMDKESCTRRRAKEQQAQKEARETMEQRARQLLARLDDSRSTATTTTTIRKKTVHVNPPTKPAAPVKAKTVAVGSMAKPVVVDAVPASRPKPRKVVPVAPEPDNFRSSDGKFRGPRVPAAEDEAQDFDSAKGKKKKIKPPKPVSVPADVGQDLINPRDVLAALEEEFWKIQGQMMGPLYPGIWEHLGYKKPRPKPKPRARKPNRKRGKKIDGGNVEDPLPATKRRRKKVGDEKEEENPPPPLPLQMPVNLQVPEGDAVSNAVSSEILPLELPPIVDTKVLIAEVDAGRYPSIKRYYGEHDDMCAICKEKQTPKHRLVACHFCSQVAHFACTSSRFTINDPEPEEDFMCHKCMGIILARRVRAEKRRLEKLHPGVDEPLAMEEAKMQDQQELLRGLVPGREFECVAAQGRLVEDVSEMLREAKARLSIGNEMAKINRRRYALLENFAKDVK